VPLVEELREVTGMEMGSGRIRDVPDTHCNVTFCRRTDCRGNIGS